MNYWICVDEECYCQYKIMEDDKLRDHEGHDYKSLRQITEQIESGHLKKNLEGLIMSQKSLLENIKQIESTYLKLVSIFQDLKIETNLSLARNFDIKHTLELLDNQDYESLKNDHRGIVLLKKSIEKSGVSNYRTKVNLRVGTLQFFQSQLIETIEALESSQERKPRSLNLVSLRDKSFSKELVGNDQIDVKEIAKEIETHENLTKIYLNFSDQNVKSIEEICQALGSQSQLKDLSLQLQNTQIENVDSIADALKKISNLKNFSLSLGNSDSKVKDLSSIGNALKSRVSLEKLTLDINKTEIESLSGFENTFNELKLLRTVKIDLGKSKVKSVKEFNLKGAENIVDLELNFNGTDIEEVEQFFQQASSLKKIQKIWINLEKTKIQSITQLQKWVESSTTIEQFDLDLLDTKVIENLRKMIHNRNDFIKN